MHRSEDNKQQVSLCALCIYNFASNTLLGAQPYIDNKTNRPNTIWYNIELMQATR